MENFIKFKMVLGAFVLEYEGNEIFLKNELPKLLEFASTNSGTYGVVDQLSTPAAQEREQSPEKQSCSKIEGTTSTIAAKLKVNSGPELIIAACAHLTFVKQKERILRKDIIEHIQSASTYYKKTYGSNLSKYLDTLVKSQRLTEQAKDTYALPASERTKLEAQLQV